MKFFNTGRSKTTRFLTSITRKSTQMLAGLALATASHHSVAAPVDRTLCIYDIVGANGDIYNMAQDYQVAMMKEGVNFTLKPYTDDRVAAVDFKSGQCDAVILPGVTARQFNPFTGSLEAVGAMPEEEHLKMTFRTLSTPKAQPLLVHQGYEIAGIIPGGTAYLFVNDRTVDTVEELSGKRIAIIEHDPAQPELVNIAGGSMVPASVTNFASLFNNGSVDICAAPTAAYGALELYKGLEPNGGIVDVPLGQITFQLVTHQAKFDPEFLQASREYTFSQFSRATALIQKAHADVDPKYWISIPEADQVKYQELARQARISIRDKGILEPKALTVMRKVRCSVDPALAECTAPDRE